MQFLELLEIPEGSDHDAFRIPGNVEDRGTECRDVPDTFHPGGEGYQGVELGVGHGEDVETQTFQVHDPAFGEELRLKVAVAELGNATRCFRKSPETISRSGDKSGFRPVNGVRKNGNASRSMQESRSDSHGQGFVLH